MHSSSVADASECLPFCECSRSENANGLMWIATGGRGLRIATCKKVPIGGVYPHYHWTDGVEVSSHHDDKDAASRLAEPPNRYSRAPGMTERPLADRLLSTESPVSGEPLPSILVTSSAQETPDQVHVGCCGPQALAVSDGKTLFQGHRSSFTYYRPVSRASPAADQCRRYGKRRCCTCTPLQSILP